MGAAAAAVGTPAGRRVIAVGKFEQNPSCSCVTRVAQDYQGAALDEAGLHTSNECCSAPLTTVRLSLPRLANHTISSRTNLAIGSRGANAGGSGVVANSVPCVLAGVGASAVRHVLQTATARQGNTGATTIAENVVHRGCDEAAKRVTCTNKRLD